MLDVQHICVVQDTIQRRSAVFQDAEFILGDTASAEYLVVLPLYREGSYLKRESCKKENDYMLMCST